MRKSLLILAVSLLPLSASAQRVALQQLASLEKSQTGAVASVSAGRTYDGGAAAEKKDKGKQHPCSAHIKLHELASWSSEGTLAEPQVREIVRATCVAVKKCSAGARFEDISAKTIAELTRGKYDLTFVRNTVQHNTERHDKNHANPKVVLKGTWFHESMTLADLAKAVTLAQVSR